jgi:hypothetical protein
MNRFAGKPNKSLINMCVLKCLVVCLTSIKLVKTTKQLKHEVMALHHNKERKVSGDGKHVFIEHPLPPEVKLFIEELDTIYTALLKKAGYLEEGRPSLYDFVVTIGPDGYPVIEKFVDLSDFLDDSNRDDEAQEDEEVENVEVIEDDGHLYLITFVGAANGLKVSLNGSKVRIFRGDEIIAERELPSKASKVEEMSVNNGVLVIKLKEK